MTPVHANRMIQELRASGTIRWEGPQIHIRDLAELRAKGDFDPAYLHLRGFVAG